MCVVGDDALFDMVWQMLANTVDDEAAELVDVTKEGRYLMDQVLRAPVEEKQTRKNSRAYGWDLAGQTTGRFRCL